jgi:capsular exopolysaccharide synthesis family protein
MSRYYDILKQASRSSPPVGDRESTKQELAKEDEIEISTPLKSFHLPDDFRQDDAAEWASGQDTPSPESPSAALLEEVVPFACAAHPTFDRNVPVIAHATHPAVLEHYRRLRTKLVQQNAIKPFSSLLIASAAPQEGKTITVLNLAVSFGLLPSFKILVVDGDFRRGGLGKCLGLDDRPGLGNLIDGSASEEETVLDCGEVGFHFVGRGNSGFAAAELLQREQLNKQFLRWKEQFDLVLLDSSPLNLLTDTHLLAEHCDAVLLVARPFYTRQKLLEKALQDLKSCRVLGTVLNGASATQTHRGYSEYY